MLDKKQSTIRESNPSHEDDDHDFYSPPRKISLAQKTDGSKDTNLLNTENMNIGDPLKQNINITENDSFQE